MARMPPEGSKKRVSDKAERTKKENSAGRAKKNVPEPARSIGPPRISAEAEQLDTHQSMAALRTEKETEDNPTALQESENASDEPMSNGRAGNESEPMMHHRIAERAYRLFQESGCRHGHDWAHWFEAERQIKES